MKFKPLSRRHVLRGVLGGAGVAIALPWLEAMRGRESRALAQAMAAPKRFFVFFWGNGRGVDSSRWTPAATGPSYELSPELQPLLSMKDYLNLATNFNITLSASSRGHHTGSVGMLSGDEYVEQDAGGSNYRSTFRSPSIDQVAADHIGTSTAFRSLELGASSHVASGEGTTTQFISHNGPDSANPPEIDPSKVFDRLFAMQQPEPSQGPDLGQARNALRKSVLDAVLEDLNGLKGRVGSRDQTRLDQHAEYIRAIEQRIDTTPPTVDACVMAENPGSFPEEGGQEPHEKRIQAMSQLVSLAFACDLTRVGSLQFIGSFADPVLWEVGSSRGHHEISHDGGATQAEMESSTVFIMKQLNILLTALHDTPEGDGNLLDNAVVVATSDCSDGAAHSVADMPLIVAGGGGGALKYPGIHHHGNGDNTTRVLLTALQAAGCPITELGGGGGYSNQPLTEILT